MNFNPETLEPIFEKYADIINEWAYVTLNSDELIYPTCGDFYLSPAATPTKFVDGGDDSLYSYSPSTMLDETFVIKSQYNHSTSLGFTEQLYTAAGTQSIAHYWDMSDRLPTYDQHQLVLSLLYLCPDSGAYMDVRHMRQAYLWEDIPFMPNGDHEHPVVSVPILCAMTDTQVASVGLF
jgi:hypothetical protein